MAQSTSPIPLLETLGHLESPGSGHAVDAITQLKVAFSEIHIEFKSVYRALVA